MQNEEDNFIVAESQTKGCEHFVLLCSGDFPDFNAKIINAKDYTLCPFPCGPTANHQVSMWPPLEKNFGINGNVPPRTRSRTRCVARFIKQIHLNRI